MILAAGLTPAWQQILRFEDFRPGEVNRASEAHWCPSGKVLNVGLALAQLGAPCVTLAPLGGAALAPMERAFAELGARRRWIEVERATRVCTTILDAATRQTTELVENAGPLAAGELQRFAGAFAELASTARLVVLTGSLTHGAPPTFFRELAAQAPCPVLLDIRGPELLAALACRPLVVKPNREELAHTLGDDLRDDAALHRAMHAVNEQGAQWVVITSGAAPVWASSQGRLYRFATPPVEVQNPIGSGDCLMAGLAWGLLDGMEPLEAICLGMAAAAENVTRILPADVDAPRVLRRRASVNYVAV
ncbi:MAG: PfkB family carbohydrate kinase [Pirellulales bacterium]